MSDWKWKERITISKKFDAFKCEKCKRTFVVLSFHHYKDEYTYEERTNCWNIAVNLYCPMCGWLNSDYRYEEEGYDISGLFENESGATCERAN